MGRVHILGQVYAVPPVIASGPAVPAMTPAAHLIVAGGGGAPIAVTFTPPSSFDSIGAGVFVTSGVISAAPGTLLDINGFNAASSTRFFQLFDAVAVPGDGVPPITIPITVPAQSHFTLTFADGQGRTFSTGIAFCSSSTQLLKTITLIPDMIINAQFR